MILDKIAYLARLSQDADNGDKESYVTITPTGFKINIQPATPELIALTEGAFGRTFRGFTTYSGIQIGDRITISGRADKYTVRGLNDWYMQPLPHLEVILIKGDG